MSLIEIPRTLVNDILTHAQASPEDEVCGLVVVKDGKMRSIHVANVADEPANRFAMDPRGQIEAMRHIRENGEALFAIYHSHPHAPAAPSPTDLKEAAYPEALYLIVSLNTKGVLELQGFRLRNHAVESVELVVA